jgi:hypothetical protein
MRSFGTLIRVLVRGTSCHLLITLLDRQNFNAYSAEIIVNVGEISAKKRIRQRMHKQNSLGHVKQHCPPVPNHNVVLAQIPMNKLSLAVESLHVHEKRLIDLLRILGNLFLQ